MSIQRSELDNQKLELLHRLTTRSPILINDATDARHLAYYIFVLEGLGNLFPWNIFITASSYFSNRLCGTPYEGNFENFFSFSLQLFQTLGLVLSILYQNSISYKTQILWPLVLYAVIFGLTTVFVVIDMSPSTLFFLTLTSTSLCGFFTAFLTGGLFGLSAKFPPMYTGAVMTGQGVAGLIVSISSLVTTIAGPSIDDCNDNANGADDTICEFKVDYGAFSYFLLATLVLAVCVALFYVLLQLPITTYYLNNKRPSTIDDKKVIESHISESSSIQRTDSDSPFYHAVSIANDDVEPDEPEVLAIEWLHIWNVFLDVKSAACSVAFTFIVTIGIFPSLVVFIESTQKCVSDNRFSNDLYTPFLFFVFNLCDLIGRYSAGNFRTFLNSKNIWLFSFSRIIFFPLFMMCNVSSANLPVLFRQDYFPIVFMVIFALSNGYVASASMIMGPTLTSLNDSSLAGTIMAFSLTLGLLLGTCISFLVVFIARG